MAQYEVVRSEEFEKDLASPSVGPKDGRLTQVVDAVEDALSRNPLVGEPVRSGVRRIVGRPPQSMPLAFYYVAPEKGNVVTLVGVRSFKM